MSLVKKCRASLGLTQVEFGKKLGVSDDVVSRLERGITTVSTALIFKMNTLVAARSKKVGKTNSSRR